MHKTLVLPRIAVKKEKKRKEKKRKEKKRIENKTKERKRKEKGDCRDSFESERNKLQ